MVWQLYSNSGKLNHALDVAYIQGIQIFVTSDHSFLTQTLTNRGRKRLLEVLVHQQLLPFNFTVLFEWND